MDRNTLTTISKLQIGDRFHKANDKKKIVWEKIEEQVKQTYFRTYKHFAKKDGDKYSTAMNSTTEVVFLRSVTN